MHRIPYPPNKGDKIRSYHLLAHLATRFKVHLGTFVDDPEDWQHVETVKRLCGETYFASLHPFAAKLRSLRAFPAGRAMTLDYYRDAGMHAWVRKIVGTFPIDNVVVFSSAMAQYAEGIEGARRIADFVDVDSEKWSQYAAKKTWPLNWLYRREGRELLHYECQVARNFDASLFVSEAEAGLFCQRAPECAERVGYFSNGVDTEYFSPDRHYDNPYPASEQPIVFTGAMDYWPNVDAVQAYATRVFPAVRKRHPDAAFYIVGARPDEQVKALANFPGVRVTGTVPDVRPYIFHARVSVAPLRIARGIQNKVLEAMAMAKPIIVSAAALEGIDAEPGSEVLLASGDQQFVDATSAQLRTPLPEIGRAARRKVVANYGWAANLSRIDALLEAGAGSKRVKWSKSHWFELANAGERA